MNAIKETRRAAKRRAGRNRIGAARNFPENEAKRQHYSSEPERPGQPLRVADRSLCSLASTAAAKSRTYCAALAKEKSSDRYTSSRPTCTMSTTPRSMPRYDRWYG